MDATPRFPVKASNLVPVKSRRNKSCAGHSAKFTTFVKSILDGLTDNSAI